MNDIIIRPARLSDVGEILKIYSPYVRDTAITFEYDVPAKREFKERISATLSRYPYLVAVCGGEISGYAYAGQFHSRAAYSRSAELSVYVERTRKRTGIGGALYRELEKELRQMGILNLYACIAYSEDEDEYLTHDSVEFHRHMGFELVGKFHKCGCKFGRWYDMVYMEKIIGEHK